METLPRRFKHMQYKKTNVLSFNRMDYGIQGSVWCGVRHLQIVVISELL